MNKLLFVIRLAAIILTFFVAAEQTEKFIIFGCYICLVDMIIIFIIFGINPLTLDMGSVKYLVDIAFTIPWWCFIARFISISAWFTVAILLLPIIGGLICVYNNHKNHHKSLTKTIN